MGKPQSGGSPLRPLSKAKQRARPAHCLDNNRQLGLAAMLYKDDYDDRYHHGSNMTVVPRPSVNTLFNPAAPAPPNLGELGDGSAAAA